jgi:hypothetical protein
VSTHEVYRDGKLHVMSDKCSSCIFRSVNDGRIRGLRAGRVGEMVTEARANESVIPCHQTIHMDDEKPAVCRGYYDNSRKLVIALRLAVALDIIKFVDPEEES